MCEISVGGLGETTAYAVIRSIFVLVLPLYGSPCVVGNIFWPMRLDSFRLLAADLTKEQYLLPAGLRASQMIKFWVGWWMVMKILTSLYGLHSFEDAVHCTSTMIG